MCLSRLIWKWKPLLAFNIYSSFKHYFTVFLPSSCIQYENLTAVMLLGEKEQLGQCCTGPLGSSVSARAPRTVLLVTSLLRFYF